MSSRNGWDTLSGTTWWLYPQACLHYRAVSGRGIMNQFILTKKKELHMAPLFRWWEGGQQIPSESHRSWARTALVLVFGGQAMGRRVSVSS